MSASGPVSRDNHYVPLTYLKRWASADLKIYVYRTLVSHESVPEWRAHSLKGIAYHQHLYSQVGHGTESDDVERWLAQTVDSPTEPVLLKVASESRLTASDWQVLLRFFAASQARTPAFFFRRQPAWNKELPALMTQVLNKTVAAIEEGSVDQGQRARESPFVGNVESPTRVRVRKNPTGEGGIIETEMVAGRKLWFLEIERMVAHTWKALPQLHWTILRPPARTLWLTSDDPAVVARISHDQNVTWNGGWMEPGAVLLLPLDPEHVLYGKLVGPMPVKYSEASSSDALFIQNCTARHAFRMVFGREKDAWVPLVKPRRVDPAAYEHERKEWGKYHEVQTKAEMDLDDDSTWHTPESEEKTP